MERTCNNCGNNVEAASPKGQVRACCVTMTEIRSDDFSCGDFSYSSPPVCAICKSIIPKRNGKQPGIIDFTPEKHEYMLICENCCNMLYSQN